PELVCLKIRVAEYISGWVAFGLFQVIVLLFVLFLVFFVRVGLVGLLGIGGLALGEGGLELASQAHRQSVLGVGGLEFIGEFLRPQVRHRRVHELRLGGGMNEYVLLEPVGFLAREHA